MKEDLELVMKCKDHTVSGETFELCFDEAFEMLVTKPKPDDSSLSKYYESEDYISHTDAKRSVLERMYHIVKSHALSKKVGLIQNLNKGSGDLLDIGAGTGDFLLKAKNRGWNISGVEPNISAMDLALQKNIKLLTSSSNFKDKTFDVITMWHVLEHVPDLNLQITELKRLLKEDGHVVIAVPNYKSYDAKHYKSFWAAYDVPRHLWHFSKTSIERLFKKYDMEVVETRPLFFDSFYVSLLSEKYKTSKMNFLKAFYVGLRSNFSAFRSGEYSSLIYVIKKIK